MVKLPSLSNPFPGWRDHARLLWGYRTWRWSGYLLWSALLFSALIWLLSLIHI